MYFSKDAGAFIHLSGSRKARGGENLILSTEEKEREGMAVGEGDPRTVRILLVEDDPMVRDLVDLILKNRGWDVIAADSGEGALAAWETGGIDLILMDVQMPGMDGLETTRAIRRAEGGSGTRTPIIAMTAHAREEDKEQCLEAGMDDYLSKPIRMGDLYSAVERHAPLG